MRKQEELREFAKIKSSQDSHLEIIEVGKEIKALQGFYLVQEKDTDAD